MNELRNRLFIGILGEQKERHRPASVMEFREQLQRFRIARFVFEKNQVVRLLLQHAMRFVQRARMLEFCRQHAAVPLQNLANKEKVLLFFSD
jgi:hypothetical protein